ncbi:hypothetical protein PENARI_c047G07013 [Penicillium arizonense]|uniref:Uncharacterized protein n=1 Tax=Penicillium arizonense TaxID=1835702 RepID=A0A1F5L2T8_PENAI|nr:hypothetical protein PENARI_c047G07013 [Penicillium arizonense]OGE47367.1 hypothetical protein PENARI_c047G07013 [Penicillium arizonense]
MTFGVYTAFERTRSQPAVHRTPADYVPVVSPSLVIPKPPVVSFPERRSEIWNILYNAQGVTP